VSPRWTTVGNASLYFYPDEPHRRPHVDVVGPDWNVTIALDDLEVLVSAGKVPPRTIKRVLEVLQAHQQQAIEAYHATMEHRFPGTLDTEEDGP
jgi:hypothetical protein